MGRSAEGTLGQLQACWMPGCRHQLSRALPHCRRLPQQWDAHSHESTQHYHIYILFKPLVAPAAIAAPKESPSRQTTHSTSLVPLSLSYFPQLRQLLCMGSVLLFPTSSQPHYITRFHVSRRKKKVTTKRAGLMRRNTVKLHTTDPPGQRRHAAESVRHAKTRVKHLGLLVSGINKRADVVGNL